MEGGRLLGVALDVDWLTHAASWPRSYVLYGTWLGIGRRLELPLHPLTASTNNKSKDFRKLAAYLMFARRV